MSERLPTITDSRKRGETGIALDLLIRPDLLWFQGHFPHAPILPGVVQIHWAVEFARTYLGLDLCSASEFQIKFKAIIRPDDALVLNLDHEMPKNRVALTYARGDEVCSTGWIFLP